tara:strand:+ start:377 stop:613 length:237 start_codon:yes stop_codon:yes gene_type:complete
MDREYFYKKARELEQRSETELQRRKDNLDFHLKKNPSHSYASIANMRDALRKVQTGKHKDTTFDANWERLTNSSYKYK